MSTHRPYTFRSSEHMCAVMDSIMEERNLDRSSVIRLALYLLGATLSREDMRRMNLFELVADLEKRAPADYPDFGSFSEQ